MRNGRRHVVITAPWGTPEETARLYGIPKRRAAELKRMVEESLAKKGFISIDRKASTADKNGAGRSAPRSHRLKVKVRVPARVRFKSGNASRRKKARAKTEISR
jgi:hypothetical protein